MLITLFTARLMDRKRYRYLNNGINCDMYADIGGIKQFLRICGSDIRNPIILYLHGGPGMPTGYINHFYREQLWDSFTFADWDQRGCGRTYIRSRKKADTESIISDIDEIVTLLCERFKKDKIIIMAHSWGTVPGLIYCSRHPERVLAYVGVGQVINLLRGDTHTAGKVALLAGDEGWRIAQYGDMLDGFGGMNTFNSENLRDYGAFRSVCAGYLPPEYALKPGTMLKTLTSPFLSFADLAWLAEIRSFSKRCELSRSLVEYMLFHFDAYSVQVPSELPVHFITGKHDWTTPGKLVEDYYKKSTAKEKSFAELNSGHSPFFECPDEFCNALRCAISGYR